MKIHAHKLGIAGALTTGVWYVVFAFFAKLWPTKTVGLITSLYLLKPLPILARYLHVTTATFVFGLFCYLLFGYLFLGMIGLIYNFMQNK